MHCPYCSIEYSPENVCFCLPMPQAPAEIDRNPDGEFPPCDEFQGFPVDPLWSDSLPFQLLALSGLA